MPLPKRGVSATDVSEATGEDEISPQNSPRRRANDTFSPRGSRGRIESPTKSAQVTPSRRPLTSADIRAEASPIIPRGRGRPPLNKTPLASKVIGDSDVSPSRRSRRLTEQTGDEDLSSSPRKRAISQSTVDSRKSPFMSPSIRRGRKRSEMEPDEQSESTEVDETQGRGKRKRKLTEAAEASQAQFRSRKSSRRISESTEHLDAMEPIREELTEPIEEEEADHEAITEVVHEEMVHAVSPQEMYMQQPHLPVRAYHSMVGGSRTTRGMHIVSDHDDMLDQQLVEEEHAIDDMVMYDDEGNMVMGYEDEMAHEEIIEGEEDDLIGHDDPRRHAIHPHEIKEEDQNMMRHQDVRRQQLIQPHAVKEEVHQTDGQEEEEDDEEPPQLEPEEGPGPEEIMMHENMERGQLIEDTYEDQGYIRVQSPGGTTYYQEPSNDDDMYVEGIEQDGMMQLDEGETATGQTDLRTVEFNFLDNKHICCGMCGEIVPYDNLLQEHLPQHHPEVFGEGMDLEEINYDTWLKDKLNIERKAMENGFRSIGYTEPQSSSGRMARNSKLLRRISQVRVNPSMMTLQQLDAALNKKMVEKMGRRVKVSLVDKMHARCGICNAVVSLNKKFEVIHLVRHFNAWHPSTHRCAGTWPNRAHLAGPGKPLSCQDFAVVDVALDSPESLQCIWCGMFMDRTMLAMHFHEVHPDDVEVPKCHLCLQEIVINARLMEKFGEDFEITLPDEHHIRCPKVQGNTFSTEAALDKCIEKRLRRMQAVESGEPLTNDEDEEAEDEEGTTTGQSRDAQYSNSRMTFGKRNKPKRNFIMPSLRQAIPQDSRYVEALSEGEWRCKMCGEPILAAVISAGAIKHYRQAHPEQLEDMQYELCKARLERVSDGCMEFVHPQLIECLICNLTYALHKPYNMCRGIRHLKTKHPEMMPEFNRNIDGTLSNNPPVAKKQYKPYALQRGPHRVEVGEYVDDPAILRKLKDEYDIEFDKVQTMYGPDGQQVFVLVANGQEVDGRVAENLQASILDIGESAGGEEEGVIVEEEEYPMEEELVVRRDGAMTAVGRHQGVQRHQMEMVEEEVVEEGLVEEGEDVHEDMGGEREMMEEEIEEQDIHYP